MIFFPKMIQSLQISNVVILLIIADDDILIFLIHHQAKQLDNNYDYCCHLSLLLFPLYIIFRTADQLIFSESFASLSVTENLIFFQLHFLHVF